MASAILHNLAVVLACVAVAGPLARAEWVTRAPRLAVVLWQLVLMAALLSVPASLLGVGLAGHPGSLVVRVWRWCAGGYPDLPMWRTVFVAAGLLVLAVIAIAVLVGHVRVALARRRHRMLLDLVGRSDPGCRGAVVLDHPTLAAYCLPGQRPTVVVTAGALRGLRGDELAAVLAHERAHLVERHDLVVLMFTVFAGLVRIRRLAVMRDAVALLMELCADDRAARQHGRHVLAAALLRFAGVAPMRPPGALAAAGADVLVRVRRLRSLPPPLPMAVRVAIVSGGLLLFATPLSLALWPA
ncbi:M56 family metallopeptidase [Fodinicola acaciae]|uniref:M56 family metallopeptidase n=1 Tax=Fodinicola acaciae TaxID=2681555 RepID=UPI0013D178BA|nr:M56 family metallopeptidase [Fodinicola acaciae]